jgi:hypothetical protein
VPTVQSAIFDFPSLLTVILLLICSAAFVRSATLNAQTGQSFLDEYKKGFTGIVWKAARIGERLSPWVAVCCVIMAVHVLFLR